MKRALIITTAAALLTACQGTNPVPPPLDAGAAAMSAHVALPATDACASLRDDHEFLGRGNRHPIHIPGIGQREGRAGGGTFGYGYLNAKTRGADPIFTACNYNFYNIPVPAGYTADWFGSWNVCNGECTFTFVGDGGSLTLRATTLFQKGVQYYMYVYTAVNKQMLESYPIPIPRRQGPLVMPTPFQDGLVEPLGDFFALEIVHQAS
jgi:hypothetical protein